MPREFLKVFVIKNLLLKLYPHKYFLIFPLISQNNLKLITREAISTKENIVNPSKARESLTSHTIDL